MLGTDFWKRYFETYDVLNELIPYQELTDTIIDKLEIQGGDKVLDLGSGTGNVTLKVKKRGTEAVGIDFSPEGVARHKLKDPTAIVIVRDITKPLPFEDESFDKALSNNVIYTVPPEKRDRVFKELYRVLKPGGIVVISNPKQNYKPFLIYLDHIKKQTKRDGLLATLGKMLSHIIPTIKIFYYNAMIRKEGIIGTYQFVGENNQKTYLQKAGFRDISNNIYPYAKQAILNTARK